MLFFFFFSLFFFLRISLPGMEALVGFTGEILWWLLLRIHDTTFVFLGAGEDKQVEYRERTTGQDSQYSTGGHF